MGGIGERLAELRRTTGESLQQVADAVGVSKVHVWDLEKGRSRNPAYELVRKLAEHFGVTVDALAGQADLPDAADREIARLYRDLGELDADDRMIVADMVATLKARRERREARG